ncbi:MULTISPECIES: hypothetical protein [Pseudomonas]|uniref:hypothetical protein n=1 Tax=Pseudomonas TaxID=286 RepID=UPI000761E74E|nr:MULTISPECIES: hypothetical protein [Pseudomonas]MDG9809450.1 hypothetical protein [Pseudomonas juntendi]MDG9815807.1 hypothetical protein [Pseudomonas putida]
MDKSKERDALYGAVVAMAVTAKLQELAGIPFGMESGRRLDIGGITPEKRDQYMSAAFAEIAQRLGVDLFRQTPAVLLEQLAVMSALKDHDTAGLLKSMINSFLIAYVTPETHERAYAHLQGLESLRGEIAANRAACATKH